jgi:hypothetical protein
MKENNKTKLRSTNIRTNYKERLCFILDISLKALKTSRKSGSYGYHNFYLKIKLFTNSNFTYAGLSISLNYFTSYNLRDQFVNYL